MSHLFTVTKTFDGLPTAHCQFQDESGVCASLHGYDRIVTMKVSAKKLDEYGWVFPFGAFKDIRKWLEYYFDHTSVFPANDPRMKDILKAKKAGILSTARVLPYGVSMEMSALFMYQNVNRYVYEQSGGRACVTYIEFREHNKNAGEISIDFDRSMKNATETYFEQLSKQESWLYVEPHVAVNLIL